MIYMRVYNIYIYISKLFKFLRDIKSIFSDLKHLTLDIGMCKLFHAWECDSLIFKRMFDLSCFSKQINVENVNQLQGDMYFLCMVWWYLSSMFLFQYVYPKRKGLKGWNIILMKAYFAK